MKIVLVLQVGGGDSENLCPVCGTPCWDSSIFTSSHKPIGITSVFVLRTALKKWNWSLDLVRLEGTNPEIIQVDSEGSTTQTYLAAGQTEAETPQESAHSVVSLEGTTHLGNWIFVFLLSAKCLVLDIDVYKYWFGFPFLPSARSIESKDISPSTICWLLPFCPSPSPSAWARWRAAPRFPLRTRALGKENNRCWGKNNTLSGRKNTLAEQKNYMNFPASQTFSWIASGCRNSSNGNNKLQ